MKIFGSIKELVSAVFRRNSQEITVQPNNSGSYTGAVDFQLPPVLTGNDILVSENATQPLTNKTIDGDSNTLQDMPVTIFKTSVGDADKVLLRDGSGAPTQAKIVNINVDNAAAIARSKLGSGTASHVIINDGSGNFSSEAQLAKSRGGAGADMTNVTFPSTGTLVTRDATETLLNKTVVSSTGATTGALTLPSGTTAQQPTPTNGMIRYNTDNGAFEGYAAGAWAGIGGGGTTDKISQAGHGFVVGDLLYLNGSTYTKAIASAANTAEVVGMVSRVIDSATFDMTLSGEVSGLTGLTAGGVYFLSPSSAGGYTTTEPTTIGQVSVPVGVASSTTTMYVMPKRGVVVGGTNARTEISLSNNASTNTQLVTAYDAGEMTGWVVITGTTSYRFYVAVQFSKNAAGTDYNVSYQTSGETPPAGFSIQYSSNYITVTLPNVAGFSSAKLNYALNAPAVGATFPLAVDGANVTAASATAQGTVTTGAQTFAGAKTFQDAPVIGNASGIAAASGSAPGVVTTTAQTFAGVKTFNNGIKPGSGQDTLANYIQGTFTPEISCSTPGTLSVTYTNRTGQYTRIGNVLYFAINVEINTISIGTASGAVFISNMPSFTYDVTINKRAYFPGRVTLVTFPAGNTYTAFQMTDSSGVIYLSVGGSDAAADIQISALGNGDTVSVSGFCFVS